MAAKEGTKAGKGKKTKVSPKPEQTAEVTAPVEVAEIAPTPKQAPEAQKYTLTDIARRFAVNFNPNWMPGIIRYAKTQNFSEPATEEECKTLLRRWGARIK